MLECATPEAVIRVRKSIALSHEADDIFDMYFTEEHRSLQDLLNSRLKEDREKNNDGIMMQVRTDILTFQLHILY